MPLLKSKACVFAEMVMATPVLIDGSHFLSKSATGMGSYARTLARALRESGCDVSVLYGQRMPARRGLPLRLPAQVFGNDPHAGKWLAAS